MTVYLDCAATTPIEPRVLDRVVQFMGSEFGNAGSRTHEFGVRARSAVEQARGRVAQLAGVGRGEVVFTSGATESNNLAILGLADAGQRTNRRHLISARIEHHATLEPLRHLQSLGFELTLLAPTPGGWIDPATVRQALRDDTLLVSIMHVNNETGVVQPIEEIADVLGDCPAYLHVDAAQSFGKLDLRCPRIDLMSVSGHKMHAPKGIGALIARRRGAERPPLKPLMLGGGQELGLRPGTLATALIVGLGEAADLALRDADARRHANQRFRRSLLEALAPLEPMQAGAEERTIANIINVSFPGIDAEDAIDALAGLIAISSGAACTSQSRECSHVLAAMGVSAERAGGALRFSWCHLTPEVDWAPIVSALRAIRRLS